jgi:hypothetical protein
VDISTSVRSFRYARGRASEFDQFQAGTASLELDNRARAFDPELQGNGLLGSPFRISVVTPDGTTRRLFRGQVTDLPQAWGRTVEGLAITNMSAVDGFTTLEQRILSSPQSEYVARIASPRVWYPFAESSDSTQAIDRSTNGFHARRRSGASTDSLIGADPGQAIVWTSTMPGRQPRAVRLPDSEGLSGPFADSTTISSTRTWVISCWARPAAATHVTTFQPILWLPQPRLNNTSTSLSGALAIADSTNGRVQASWWAYASSDATWTTHTVTAVAGSITPGTPYHVVLKITPTQGYLYINGVLKDSELGDPAYKHVSFSRSSPANGYIGRMPTAGTDAYQGVYIGALQHFIAWRFDSSADSPGSTAIADLYDAGDPAGVWNAELTGARVTRVLDLCGWPSSQRSISAGVAQTGAAADDLDGTSVLSHLQSVGVDGEAGRLFVDGQGRVVFQDRHWPLTSTRGASAQVGVGPGETLGWEGLELRHTDADVVNRAIVTRAGGEPQEWNSTASVDKYGPRTAQLSDVPLASDAEAQSLGQWIVVNNSSARSRVEQVRLNLGQSTGAAASVLAREVGDMVTVTDGSVQLCLPANGYASTPDDAALDITGDIDLRARIAPADWTPLAAQIILSKMVLSASNNASYLFALNTDGALILGWSALGTQASILLTNSTVPVTPPDTGAPLWVRVTMDVNDGAGNRVIKFYTSTSATSDHTAVSWTQLGSTVTTAGTTSIFSGTSALYIGRHPENLNQFNGYVLSAAVLNGIGGTVVANPVFTSQQVGATSFTDSAGRTWTVGSPGKLAGHKLTGWIEGLSVESRVGAQEAWTVTWQLSNAGVGQADYLVLNSTTRGYLDQNRVGF